MAIVWMRGAAGVVVVAALALGTAGCSGDGDPGTAASKAASAVESAGAAVSSAASGASDAAASAAAVARDKLGEVKDGVDAKAEVTLGAPAADGEGFTTVPVSVKNTDGSAKSFAVQVNLKDESGNLLDTVVVTVSDVPGNATGQGTARSTHKLSGTVTAETGTALRY
ncbi:hypothetical protein [Streptomyces antarcticus]|uniref:hypothetical protein n=1 Tax=Streptomyces antarcticus TaxID=2996458 RepID=UPI00226E8DCA|nr:MULTISPECIES: hypothetical protein [unclassified Streptomyces]MCY0943242.1 hypothetical protein [Streptomyces sp. H34-AA3]MCZ4085213.1 hypothetical protein [Streptomyces sp. H34-S5]